MKRWLVLALALAGCSSTMHWTRAGATPQDFARDSYQCALESRQDVMKFGPPLAMMLNDGEKERVNKHLYRACLETYGYQRVEGGEFVGLRD